MSSRRQVQSTDYARRGSHRSEHANAKAAPSDLVAVWLAGMLILFAGIVAYSNSFAGVFLLDDQVHILGNPSIRSLSEVWRHLSEDSRPLVMLSIAINYALDGYSVAGYHAFNLAVHLIAGLALFGVVRRILLIRNLPRATGLAAAISLLWTIHPLQTQAVTYIIQRGESMMGMFYLLTVYFALRAATAPRIWPWCVAAASACAAGMLSKPIMVTAPLMVLIVDRVVVGGSWREMVTRRWPLYAALTATWFIPVSRGVVQSILDTSAPASETGLATATVTPSQYAMTQAAVVLHYLRLSVWPHPLVFDYMWPLETSITDVAVQIAILFLLVLLTCWGLWRRSLLALAGAWFFLILSPTSSVIPILDAAVEHRMYLPLAGVIVVVVATGQYAVRVIASRRAGSPASGRGVEMALLILVVAALVIRTYRRNADYQSDFAIWSGAVASRPDNARARDYLGTAYEKKGDLDNALRQYQEGHRLQPQWSPIWSNYAKALVRVGRIDESIREYEQLLAQNPEMTHARMNLALAYQKLNRLEDAVREYQIGLAKEPSLVPPRNNLGAALMALGRYPDAEAAFRASLKYAPNDLTARHNLAVVLEAQGRRSEAIAEYRAVLRLDPRNIAAQSALQKLVGASPG